MIGTYKNGNYTVIVEDDGTKSRMTEEGSFVPNFAESCDVKITNKCSQGCAFCYEGCTKKGEHADLNQSWIDTLHPFTELALNGNDLDHPQLEEFLTKLKSKQVIANLTVNQNQFMMNLDKLRDWSNAGLIHGLGVSLVKPTDTFIEALKDFPNAVIHTINGLLTEEDINKLGGHNLKLLILGYKNLRRGNDFLKDNLASIVANQEYIYWHVAEIARKFKLICFDNLALIQVDAKRLLSKKDWDSFYMGNDGSFTFYIDMVEKTFAKNSLSTNRHKLLNNVDDMFNVIRGEE